MLAVYRHRVVVHKAAPTVQHFHPFVLHITVVPSGDVVNVVLTGVDQLAPRETFVLYIKPKVGSITQGFGNVCTKPHYFFRYTANIDTRATQFFSFDYRAFFSVFGGALYY